MLGFTNILFFYVFYIIKLNFMSSVFIFFDLCHFFNYFSVFFSVINLCNIRYHLCTKYIVNSGKKCIVNLC